MTMQKKILIPAGVLVVALSAWLLIGRSHGDQSTYRFATVERGDVRAVVTSTGVLEATETVDVGTQVSGQIAELFVDFNDRVTRGQLLARIDPTILEQEVRAAQANVIRSGADVTQAKRAYDRAKELFDEKVITEGEFEQAEYSYAVAQASATSSQVNLERARRNLSYTEVRAPIDGVVVQRSVDVGQTVAASMSAPTLFLIARDLSEMQILASVDESDIGRISQGQRVNFTVQAHGDTEFTGTVRQVRLQSTMTDNVVSYAVVIAVPNPDGRLLPGMTATASFVVQEAENVLRVPNAALRYQPPEDLRAAAMAALQERTGDTRGVPGPQERAGETRGAAGAEANGISQGAPGTDGAPAPRPGAAPEGAPSGRNGGASDGTGVTGAAGAPGAGRMRGGAASRSMLWVLNDDGTLTAMPVRQGLTDGQFTEVMGPGITEGMQVITGETGGAATQQGANPFQNNQQRPTGPGGFGGPRF